eukprot:11052271-Karenia_brevis.AAC.1
MARQSWSIENKDPRWPQAQSGKKQNKSQAQGLSNSGESPAAAIGKPFVVCPSYHAKKCGGSASLESLATTPSCACGTPYIIS